MKKILLGSIAVIGMVWSTANFVNAAIPSVVVRGGLLFPISQLGRTVIIHCGSDNRVCVSIFVDPMVINIPGGGGEKNRAIVHATPPTTIRFKEFDMQTNTNGEKSIAFTEVN